MAKSFISVALAFVVALSACLAIAGEQTASDTATIVFYVA